jgi:hypothetical protein
MEIGPPAAHFLELDGLGIRDLARDGEDLLVLAGPTMLLDGPSRVLRIRGAGAQPPPLVVRSRDIEQVGSDLDVGVGDDHPEGIAVLDRRGARQLMVIYDSPSDARVKGSIVRADLLPLT